ncbi:MAG: type III pantothenate kinase [Oscillospiraceae bacterium]|nr:type III pantothenate kinase [Oscillospiraceae bacterium]MBQ7012808.1 type III pantothenate kinase [Oscillospiraceae bacterium]
MLLTVDMGNTNIVVGCLDGDKVRFTERISTDLRKTELEYLFCFKAVLELYQISPDEVEGAVISSVVPPLTDVLKKALQKLTHAEILVVGPGVKTGLHLKMDNPAAVGSDLVVDAVAASALYGTPAIVIDMGTATTLSVLDREGAYVGTIILPGARISLDSLVSGTAQLPKIGLTVPRQIIGTNTVDCMRSGILYGSAACLDGMIDRIWEELGYETAVIATGGLAHAVVPHCFHEITVNDTLLLHGLRLIYEKNKKVRTEGGTS